MIRSMTMLLACLLVSGAMAFILIWFFKRLKKIERDLWGDLADRREPEKSLRSYFKKKKTEEPGVKPPPKPAPAK